MKAFFSFLAVLCFSMFAHAGFEGIDNTGTSLKLFNRIKCSTGMTCTRVGDKFTINNSGTLTGPVTITGGIVVPGISTNYMGWKPSTLTSGTSTTPSATTLYMAQVHISGNVTLTGIKVNSAATVGTNKYIVAFFDSLGNPLATSALAGVTTANADAYQTIAFTAPYAAVGPGAYWIGLYVNGTTDRFRSVPAVGQYGGLAGTVTGQTFGTVVAVTPPTTFTADVGPVAFTY